MFGMDTNRFLSSYFMWSQRLTKTAAEQLKHYKNTVHGRWSENCKVDSLMYFRLVIRHHAEKPPHKIEILLIARSPFVQTHSRSHSASFKLPVTSLMHLHRHLSQHKLQPTHHQGEQLTRYSGLFVVVVWSYQVDQIAFSRSLDLIKPI